MAEQTNTVTIEKIVQQGKGLARLDGRVVLVDRVLPGEQVRVTLRPRRGVLEGTLVSVSDPSVHRETSDCPFYDHCGGCDFRHTNYMTELSFKKSMLKETLARIGKVDVADKDIEVIASPERNRYRIRTRVQCKNGKKGFFEKGSRKIIAIDDCLLMPEHLVPVLSKTRCRNSFYLETHPFDDACFRYRKMGEAPAAEWKFDTYVFFHAPGNFVQANRFLLNDFARLVCQLAGKGDSLLELFAGSGFLTLPLSRQYQNVVAMEWAQSALDMMRRSLAANHISNVSIRSGDCNNCRFEHGKVETLVVDPPREGLDAVLAGSINRAGINRIVYVSCNAATLARDIARFPNFNLKRLILIDMFPGTAHFETMALLVSD